MKAFTVLVTRQCTMMTCFVETSIYPVKWEYKMLKSFQSSKINS